MTGMEHVCEDEEESYFVSMTDMMVGLVFIFIIMLMYFALQYKSAEQDHKQVTEKVLSADEARTHLLEEMQVYLEKKGIKVTIDPVTGVLRLPNEILFERARANVSEEGRQAIGVLAGAFRLFLPCYTYGLPLPADCPTQAHRLEAIYVEGHTDSDKMQERARYRDNWELSVARAVSTYRELIAADPELGNLRNRPISDRTGTVVLSVSGYGDKHPVVTPELTEEDKRQNRRIDIRLIMATPRKAEFSKVQKRFDAALSPSTREQ